MYNFPEKALGPDFASDKMKQFRQLIDANLSFVVISLPGVGVSCFLKFLAVQDFATFIHVDLYSLPSLSLHEFYKLLLTELGGKPSGKSDERLIEEIKKNLRELSQKRGKIVIIFSRFDQLKNQFNPTFLSNIQSLTTISNSPVVEIFTSTKPLYKIAPDALTGGNLNFYSEELYFKPYTKDDLKKLLKVDLAKPVSASVLDELMDLSGGHNQLFRILLSSQKQQNLSLDRFVKMQMKELVDYLDYHQRKQLQKLALGKTVEEIDEYLEGVGLVKNSQIFTPLLSEYIKTNMPVRLPAKENILFKLLKENIGKTVTKDEIFAAVWPDSEEATDWALDALIYRMRNHPYLKAQGYIIESQKKVGYTLIAS
ncbi:helix-turn-helix domain-containing protein [Candidatus Daviesbacteria bacterium]|nr:helix-turn-helix domain-containing protein [Candidatus Daviesbacteria bacterium]